MDIELRRKILNFVYSRDIQSVTKRISNYIKKKEMKYDFKSFLKSIPHTAPENICMAWERLCQLVNYYIKGYYNNLQKEEKIIVDILIGVL